jgi:DNA-directed RNA polymerase specialized sigma subunit
MAPSADERGPARSAHEGDRGARSLRAFAAKAERDRLAPDELARLLDRAAAGDREAVARVFDQHLGIVLRMARELARGGEPTLTEDELVQDGSLGLVAAIREFAVSHPAAAAGFAAFAEAQIAASMAAAVDRQAVVERDKRQLVEDAEAYERAEISIRRHKKREATTAELAEKLEWSEEKTRRLGEMVGDARRIHDEELLQYVDPSELSEFDDE